MTPQPEQVGMREGLVPEGELVRRVFDQKKIDVISWLKDPERNLDCSRTSL